MEKTSGVLKLGTANPAEYSAFVNKDIVFMVLGGAWGGYFLDADADPLTLALLQLVLGGAR